MTNSRDRKASGGDTSERNSELVKHMKNRELMRQVASLANISGYDPSTESESTNYKRFTKEERQQIYEAIAGDSDEDYLRNQLPRVIMEEIGSELHSNFQDEFSRKDLKEIYWELSEREEK